MGAEESLPALARAGDYQGMIRAIRQGALIDLQDEQGDTALMVAAWKGKFEIVKLLVKEGADINLSALHGFTPLMAAVKNKHTEMVQFLVEHGADIELRNKFGVSALDICTPSTSRALLKGLKARGEEEYAQIAYQFLEEKGRLKEKGPGKLSPPRTPHSRNWSSPNTPSSSSSQKSFAFHLSSPLSSSARNQQLPKTARSPPQTPTSSATTVHTRSPPQSPTSTQSTQSAPPFFPRAGTNLSRRSSGSNQDDEEDLSKRGSRHSRGKADSKETETDDGMEISLRAFLHDSETLPPPLPPPPPDPESPTTEQQQRPQLTPLIISKSPKPQHRPLLLPRSPADLHRQSLALPSPHNKKELERARKQKKKSSSVKHTPTRRLPRRKNSGGSVPVSPQSSKTPTTFFNVFDFHKNKKTGGSGSGSGGGSTEGSDTDGSDHGHGLRLSRKSGSHPSLTVLEEKEKKKKTPTKLLPKKKKTQLEGSGDNKRSLSDSGRDHPSKWNCDDCLNWLDAYEKRMDAEDFPICRSMFVKLKVDGPRLLKFQTEYDLKLDLKLNQKTDRKLLLREIGKLRATRKNPPELVRIYLPFTQCTGYVSLQCRSQMTGQEFWEQLLLSVSKKKVSVNPDDYVLVMRCNPLLVVGPPFIEGEKPLLDQLDLLVEDLILKRTERERSVTTISSATTISLNSLSSVSMSSNSSLGSVASFSLHPIAHSTVTTPMSQNTSSSSSSSSLGPSIMLTRPLSSPTSTTKPLSSPLSSPKSKMITTSSYLASPSSLTLPPSAPVPISFSSPTPSYSTESSNIARELLLQKRTGFKTRRKSK